MVRVKLDARIWRIVAASALVFVCTTAVIYAIFWRNMHLIFAGVRALDPSHKANASDGAALDFVLQNHMSFSNELQVFIERELALVLVLGIVMYFGIRVVKRRIAP